MQLKQFVCLFVCITLASLFAEAATAESNWPTWRGPNRDGSSELTDLPVEWNDSNVRWKASLPGQGQSSPVVWQDKIFLTASQNDGEVRIVMGLDRESGKIVWQHTAWVGEPEDSHRMNTFASATCATDGDVVVAFFGRGGIHAYDLNGKQLWLRDLGLFEGPWGTAASPIIVGDLVIQNCDAEDKASIIGLDKRTGKTVWETPRDKLRGWSTPVPVEVNGRTEVVVNGEHGITAYDSETGEKLWFYQGDRGRGAPTVTPYKGKLITVSGRPGAMFSVRPGGSGTVNDTHEVWRTTRRGARDLPSPIVAGDHLIIFSHNPGLASSYDAKTGKDLDRIRLKDKFSASPILANGLIYIPNEIGDVYVLKPGEKLEVVKINQLTVSEDEIFRASITPSRNELLIRSDRTLYCIQ